MSVTRTRRWGSLGVAALLAAALAVVTGSPAGSLTPPDPTQVIDKVQICHSTGSDKNPYVIHTPSADGDVSGHADHTGPVWSPGVDSWGDIIPPFKYGPNDGDFFPGLNWSVKGQAWFDNDCNAPRPGTISVTKVVIPPTGTSNAALPAGFTVNVSCDDGTDVDVSFPASGGAGTPGTIDVAGGSVCQLQEHGAAAFPAGSVVSYTDGGTVVVGNGAEVMATVTNDFSRVGTTAVPVTPRFTG